MIKTLLVVITLFFHLQLFGQLTAKVIDANTKKAIPYVNIWIENEELGTSSNLKGEFSLVSQNDQENLILSSVGYKRKKVRIEDIKKQIMLEPSVQELDLVKVIAKKKEIEQSFNSFRKWPINSYLACGKKPWRIARYIPYDEKYTITPYFKEITLLTSNDIKRAKFKLIFYEVDAEGSPGDYLYPKSIIAIAKKGKRKTSISVEDYNIKIPKTGCFISIEWIIDDENKYEYNYTMKGSKDELTGSSYEPAFGMTSTTQKNTNWRYSGGNWKPLHPFIGVRAKEEKIIQTIAMEIVMTN